MRGRTPLCGSKGCGQAAVVVQANSRARGKVFDF